MALMDYLYLYQTIQNKWLQAAIVMLFFLALAWITVVIEQKVISRLAKKTKTDVDDLIIEKIKRPLFYIVIFLGLRSAITIVNINSIIEKTIESITVLIFIYIMAAILSIIIGSWGAQLAKKTKSNVDETLMPLLQKAIKVLFVIIAILWILDIWQVDITPYLAGLGLGGLVIGLAFQDSLKNIFGGISMILDNNFNIGDAVRLEGGDMGVVQDIGLRSTKILTYNNEMIFVPNGQLANMRLTNFIQPNPRVRKIVDFTVEYGSDVAKVQKVVIDTLKKIDKIYDQPYMDVIMVQMADYGLKFQARFWADWSEAYNKWVEATTAIYNALNKAKIGIPYPTHTVHIRQEK